jgi:hypothetical protein
MTHKEALAMANPQPVVMYGPGGGDDAPWIQEKVNQLSSGGGTLLLDRGIFTLNSTVQILSFVNIVGQGPVATKFISDVAGPAFQFMNMLSSLRDCSVQVDSVDCRARGVLFGNPQLAASNAVLQRNVVERVQFYKNPPQPVAGQVGIMLLSTNPGPNEPSYGVYWNRIIDCDIHYFDRGIVFDTGPADSPTPPSPNTNVNWIAGVFFYACNTAIDIANGGGNQILGMSADYQLGGVGVRISRPSARNQVIPAHCELNPNNSTGLIIEGSPGNVIVMEDESPSIVLMGTNNWVNRNGVVQ